MWTDETGNANHKNKITNTPIDGRRAGRREDCERVSEQTHAAREPRTHDPRNHHT
jgi:hypothetical protein